MTNDPARLRDDPDAPTALRGLGAQVPPRALRDEDRARILATAALIAAGGGVGAASAVKAVTHGGGLAKGLAVTAALAGLAAGVHTWRGHVPGAPPRAARAGGAVDARESPSVPEAGGPTSVPDAGGPTTVPDAGGPTSAPDVAAVVVPSTAPVRTAPRVARVGCPVAVSEGEARVLEAASASLATTPRVAAACEASLPDVPSSPLYEERLFVRWDAARRLQRRDEAVRAAETLRRMFPSSRYARATVAERDRASPRDGYRRDASAW